MYTDKNIVFILKQLQRKISNNPKIAQMDLLNTFKAYSPESNPGAFIGYLTRNNYITYENNILDITKQGNIFIVKYNILKFLRILISYFIVPIVVVLTFIFRFIWKPDSQTTKKAKTNQTEIMDSKSDTISVKDSTLLKQLTDIK